MGLAPQNGIIPVLAIGAFFAILVLAFFVTFVSWIIERVVS